MLWFEGLLGCNLLRRESETPNGFADEVRDMYGTSVPFFLDRLLIVAQLHLALTVIAVEYAFILIEQDMLLLSGAKLRGYVVECGIIVSAYKPKKLSVTDLQDKEFRDSPLEVSEKCEKL